MKPINQYDIGKDLYHDWATQKSEKSYEIVRRLGKSNVDLALLKRGFIEERHNFVQDNEDEECFYGAMDEIGVDYWAN